MGKIQPFSRASCKKRDRGRAEKSSNKIMPPEEAPNGHVKYGTGTIQGWWQEMAASEPEIALLMSSRPMQRSHGT